MLKRGMLPSRMKKTWLHELESCKDLSHEKSSLKIDWNRCFHFHIQNLIVVVDAVVADAVVVVVVVLA